jgi:hypothetical protein
MRNFYKNIYHLLNCIWHLGFKRGFRYWRIGRWCQKDPTLIGRWINKCNKEAGKCRLRGEFETANALEDWANQLEFYRDKNLRSNPSV